MQNSRWERKTTGDGEHSEMKVEQKAEIYRVENKDVEIKNLFFTLFTSTCGFGRITDFGDWQERRGERGEVG